MATILCVDDDPSTGLLLADTLERAGHAPMGAATVAEALAVLASRPVDLIISDYRVPGGTGLELLEELAREGNDTPLIMLTGFASTDHAVASIKAGAVDYLTKPIRPAQLELAVGQALELARLRRENAALRLEVVEARGVRGADGQRLPGAGPLPHASTRAPTDDCAVVLRTLSLAEAEAALIARALEVTNRNRTRAAGLLGISVRTLRYKLNGPPRDAS